MTYLSVKLIRHAVNGGGEQKSIFGMISLYFFCRINLAPLRHYVTNKSLLYGDKVYRYLSGHLSNSVQLYQKFYKAAIQNRERFFLMTASEIFVTKKVTASVQTK